VNLRGKKQQEGAENYTMRSTHEYYENCNEINRDIASMGEKRNAYKVSTGNLEGMKHLGRPRRKWDNTKMDRQAIRWEGVDWIHLDESRVQ
jgi:hypothetical protein